MKRTCVLLLVVSCAAACRAQSAAQGTASPAPATAGAGQAAPTPSGSPAPPAVKPMPAQLPQVLARVNGEPIERWELETALKNVEARAGAPVPPDKRDEVLRGVLDQLVAYHLLAQESKARKIEVSAADVDAQIAQIPGGFPNEQAFQQALATQGLTPDQLKQQTRTSLQVTKIIDAEVSSKVAVQDADVSAFYEQNVERFKQGESVHASHILVAVPQNADAAAKTQARTKAEQLLKQARGGADFAKLARENSADSGSAQNGGDLGFFAKGQMVPPFENAAFATKVGSLSDVVETPFGFHIIKVSERRPPRTAPLAEVSPQIKDFLGQQQREQKLSAFVEASKAKAKIEFLV